MDVKADKIKNSPLKIYTTEEDLAFMVKQREKFVLQMGQEKYDRLKNQLEDYI